MVNVFTGAMNSNLTFHSLVIVHLSAIAMTKHTLSMVKGKPREPGKYGQTHNISNKIYNGKQPSVLTTVTHT